MVEDLQIVLLNKPPASALPVRLLADQLNQQIFTPSQPSIASELIVGFTEKALAQKYYSALPIHCFHNDLGIHSLDHNNRGLCQTGAALYYYVMLGNAVQANVLADTIGFVERKSLHRS